MCDLLKSEFNLYKNKISNEDITNIDKFTYLDHRNSNSFIIKNISSVQNLKRDSILFVNKKNSDGFSKNLTNVHIITDESKLFDNPNFSNITLVKDLDSSYIKIIKFIFYDSDDIEYKDEYKIINNSFISVNAEIDNNVRIGPNCVISRGVKIFKNCIIKSNSSISNSIIEENSIIGENSTVGSTGFGFNLSNLGATNLLPHIGNVHICKNVRIGSSCTIDRARLDTTYIGNNTMIDNSVHIAHNVVIGDHGCIAAQCGISGSVNIGKNLIMGGQSGIAGHLRIGNNVIIAAKSGVTKNLSDNSKVAGFPAVNIIRWKKEIINNRKNG